MTQEDSAHNEGLSAPACCTSIAALLLNIDRVLMRGMEVRVGRGSRTPLPPSPINDKLPDTVSCDSLDYSRNFSSQLTCMLLLSNDKD